MNFLFSDSWIEELSDSENQKFLQYKILAIYVDDRSMAKIEYTKNHYLASFSVGNWVHFKPSAKFYLQKS